MMRMKIVFPDDMRFEELFDAARARSDYPKSLIFFAEWRGSYYDLKNPVSVAAGFQHQAQIDRERGDLADALAYSQSVTRTPIDPQAFVGVDLAKPEAPDFADFDPRPIGRMTSEKPISSLIIRRHTNGGWLVEGRDNLTSGEYESRAFPAMTGAFTNTSDMLEALTDLLRRDAEKRKDQGGPAS
jgi:hypothetical protein